jgi:hypothetical protein
MKSLKPFILGSIVGLLLGLWSGVNIGKNRPIWANPFAPAGIGDVVRDKSADILQKGGQKLEEQGQDLRTP